MKWVMCDLDGTLLDFVLNEGDSLAEKRKKLINAIAYPCHNYFKILIEHDYRIAIVTGRANSDYGDITEAWLNKYCILHDALIMLSSPWKSRQEYYLYKSNVLESLQPRLVIDDDLRFLLMACQRGYTTISIENRSSWFTFTHPALIELV